jgi:hypothetical protein
VTIATLILGTLTALAVFIVAVFFLVWRSLRRQTERFGYRSIGEYLEAAPRTDAEKREAVNMTLKGVVICLLGLFFPPLILAGLFPLFYGARKMAWASMGLGLVDDVE